MSETTTAGEKVAEANELAGLRREMEKLADHMSALDGNAIECEVAEGILRALLEGDSASSIIDDFDLVSDEDGDEEGI